MANPHKGEVRLKAGEREVVLVATFNALCDLEDRLDLSIQEIGQKLEGDSVRLSLIRAVLVELMKPRQPDVTEDEAREIADAAGVVAIAQAVGKALTLAFAEETSGGNAPRGRRANA